MDSHANLHGSHWREKLSTGSKGMLMIMHNACIQISSLFWGTSQRWRYGFDGFTLTNTLIQYVFPVIKSPPTDKVMPNTPMIQRQNNVHSQPLTYVCISCLYANLWIADESFLNGCWPYFFRTLPKMYRLFRSFCCPALWKVQRDNGDIIPSCQDIWLRNFLQKSYYEYVHNFFFFHFCHLVSR